MCLVPNYDAQIRVEYDDPDDYASGYRSCPSQREALSDSPMGEHITLKDENWRFMSTHSDLHP